MRKWKIVILTGAMALMTGCSSKAETAETAAGTVSETALEAQTENAEEVQTEMPESVQAETTSEVQAETGTEPFSDIGKEADMPSEGGLAAVGELLGMQDSETEAMLGGGEENWTEDRSFYIGRIFQAEVYGETYPVYTTCSGDGIVDAVSMHMVSGERRVTEEEVEEWVNRLSEYMGAEPSGESGASEGGSRERTWRKDGKVVSLRYMEDQLSLSFQKQIGELEEGKE